MAESMQNDDLLSYINEELITNSSTNAKNEFDEELYSSYIKSENNKNENSTLSLTEKNKIELAQATIYNSITNNTYNQGLPLSPPQDDANSPNNEIYLNSQNISPNSISVSNSPSMELEALSPSSIGSEVNDVNNIKNEEQSLMNLTQLYQNSGIITTDGLINPSLLANQEFINNNVLINAMCADDTNKSQLFQVLPNTNISIPSTTYLNDPLSSINLTLPTNTNIPVTLNSNLTLPTVTVPSNTLEFAVQSNALNLDNTLATTDGLDINTLQSLTPLAMNGPLSLTNPSTINPSTIINSVSNVAATSSPSTISTTSSTTIKPTTTTTTATTSSTTTSNPPLSATLDLTSLKSSVNETLELTKKLSQANKNNSNNSIINNKDGKSNVIDVTDILKSDVAASCLNLLKGSKGKPGRKKKCLQNPSDTNSTTTSTSTSTTPSTTTGNDIKPFPYLKSLNPKTTLNNNNTNGTTGTTNVNILPAQSVKFPIIKPKLNTVSTNDNHTPILPLAPSAAKPNTINCFNNPLLTKTSTTKPLNPSLLRNTPILPNGSTDKSNNNNNSTIKTAYQKRQERLLKNREAAHLSRKRKREQLHMLETHAQELIAENQTLKLKVIELEQLNEKLVKENELLKMKINVKKEITNESEAVNDLNMNVNNEMPSDIYNLYIKPEALTNNSASTNSTAAQNNNNNKSKEIGIVFMVILLSFSLFTFPLSIFTVKNNTEVGNSIISTFMNKLSDFSLASIPSENTGKILSSSYEQENQYLLDSGHYEIADIDHHQGELELRSVSKRRRNNDENNIDMDLEDDEEEEKEKGQLTQFNKKSRKMKNTRSNHKSKQKHNTTRRNIKKNYEYTTYSELSSLMSVFHPNNVDLDKESLKQMSLLRHWIVEGFCSVHENHTYAKNSSIVKDIVKVHDNKGENGEGSTDLTVKKNGNSYYDSSKSYSKEIPWNMKQFIRFYPDTTYFYSPKLVQLFPLSPTEIMEPSIPFINNLQPNDTIVSANNTEETRVSPSSSRFNSSTSSYYGKKNEERQMNNQDNQTGTKSENQNNENVYQLPFSNKPKMAIITNIESDDINEESNSYLMIDFEIKGARLIENE
ncbi:hypothetical protein BCR32DRAFT_289547 [Anaeromyces robustus]|uniref:BZIP domain-containing protein n=1 Tax=Anaeromyces robustus TaxID=1754192 RepID=A0A1Y1XN15_9FUNG|nr:hypothetical protein BCR32DRAFT_289547 [Anaeromyces robustus]|eukprot:ORX87150.1 hypothetical protein BCR32DRAFT_289547 [Anaeromyces robustus]